LVGAAFGLGFLIGPALGGILSEFSLRAPFFAAAALASVNWMYGFFILPMDECLARAVVDLSGRAFFVYQVEVKNWMVRDFNICLVKEFFLAMTHALACNLHLRLEYGEEPHHIAESLFKVFARALDSATRFDPRLGDALPSTKGKLDG